MDISRRRKREFLAAIMAICDSQTSKILEYQRRRRFRRNMIMTLLMQRNLLIIALLNEKRARNLWMHKRHGKCWESDVPLYDDQTFKECFRMSRTCFTILCEEVKGIGKSDTVLRECIPFEKRVAIALYSLRSSAEYATIGRLFGVSKTSVWRIVVRFCKEVLSRLEDEYLPSSFLTQGKIDDCVKGFETIGFPQCLGAIDGCHIEIKPPAAEASDYYNFKGWYSMVLFALVDYRYRFIYTNVGVPGRNNDSQIFEKSSLKKILQNPLLKENAKVISGVNVPVFVIGDSAFRFSSNVMKPFPFHTLADAKEKTFNYNLSKARRVVENAFRHLKARFRRIGKGVDNNLTNAALIIRSCCVLHNFLNDQINSTWLVRQNQDELISNRTQPETVNHFRDHDNSAQEIRNAIATFLVH